MPVFVAGGPAASPSAVRTVATVRTVSVEMPRGAGSDGGAARRFEIVVAAASFSMVVLAVVYLGGFLEGSAATWVGNLVLDAAALSATGACALATRRAHGRRRTGWAWLTLGVGGWAAGNLVWSYYELVADRAAPFPSLADAGYLVLPVGAVTGVWLLGSRGREVGGAWRLVDALTITGSLLLISWSTVLPAVQSANAGALATTIALAYPVTDIVIVTAVLLALARAGQHGRALGLLAAGFVAFAGADSVFAYAVAHGHYATGDWSDLGWIGGFMLMTVAALAPDAASGDAGDSKGVVGARRPSALPFLPLVAAILFIGGSALTGHELELGSIVLAAAVGLGVMTRQYAVSRDNFGLATTLAARDERLRYEAGHDSLTALPNRRALLEHLDALDAAGITPSALAFIDLDDFKAVNDTFGHDTGDDLLTEASLRLTHAIRPHDFVARLGGDEFAVLWERAGAPLESLAERLLGVGREPVVIDGLSLSIRLSIGIARGEPEAPNRQLLQSADIAMYAAKTAGGSRFAIFDDAMKERWEGIALLEVELTGGSGASSMSTTSPSSTSPPAPWPASRP